MRKLIVGAQVSMDGVMQAPGGPTEDPTKGFKFGGWAMPFAWRNSAMAGTLQLASGIYHHDGEIDGSFDGERCSKASSRGDVTKGPTSGL